MSRGVSNVWVPVSDMDRAVAFYRDTLGLGVQSQSDEWTELDADGLTVGLNGRASEQTARAGTPGGAVLALRAEGSIEDEVSSLEGRGITFPGGIADHSWGRVAAFADPDGNELELFAPPEG